MNLLILKSIIRLFIKNKLVFSLCILGLSIGFAVFIIVTMHTIFEYSYDKNHSKANSIYRMHPIYGECDGKVNIYATSDNGYGPTLKEETPEVLDYVRMLAYQSERVISYNPENKTKRQFRESNVFLVDSNFFSFFDYKLKVGSPSKVLSNPNTMVISESAVKKYFGDENPIGKNLIVSDYGEPYQCEVTGIFYDLPPNSNLQFNFLVSFESLRQRAPGIDNSWNFATSYTYLHLAENSDINKLEKQIMDVFKARSGFDIPKNLKFDMTLSHFLDIHLDDPVQWELEKKGNRSETKYLFIIALIIIIVSWLNYINITTSLITQMVNNFRIKTILGSGKFHLVMQFLAEAFFVNLISLLIAILLISIGEPYILTFLGYDAGALIFNNSQSIILITSTLVFGTLATGFLAALVFFVTQPNFLLHRKSKNSGSLFRQVMVIAQFTTGIMLIIGTTIVYKQVHFLKSQELGVDLDNIVVIKAPPGTDAHTRGINKFKQLVSGMPMIRNVSAGSDIPGQFMDMGYMVNRTDINPPIHTITDGGRIDHDYIETLGLKIDAGKDFSEGMNTEHRVLINEAMVNLLKFKDNNDAVGKQIFLPEVYGSQPVTILGVIKNYHQQSPTYNYKPLFFMCRENEWLKFNYFLVRYNSDTPSFINDLRNKWDEAFPLSSFDYYFLSDKYERQYGGSVHFGQLFGILSFMAIIISALGLLGLSINTAQQKTKEIGVRKAIGAKVSEIVIMLVGDFGKHVMIAFIIACPIAYYVMNSWLENFAYKTALSWWIFLFAGLLALVIAIVTVSFHAIRAARANPVEALRNE